MIYDDFDEPTKRVLRTVFINVDQICYIEPGEGRSGVTGDHWSFVVTESYDDIKKLVEKSKESV